MGLPGKRFCRQTINMHISWVNEQILMGSMSSKRSQKSKHSPKMNDHMDTGWYSLDPFMWPINQNIKIRSIYTAITIKRLRSFSPIIIIDDAVRFVMAVLKNIFFISKICVCRKKWKSNKSNKLYVDSIGLSHTQNVRNNLNKNNLLPSSSNKMCGKKEHEQCQRQWHKCDYFDWCVEFILVFICLQIKSFTTHLTFLSFNTIQ